MKKKNIHIFIIGIFFLVGSFVILNYRYPFFIYLGGHWSVGYTSGEKVLEGISIDSNNIITHKHINRILSADIAYIADPFFIKKKTPFIFCGA